MGDLIGNNKLKNGFGPAALAKSPSPTPQSPPPAASQRPLSPDNPNPSLPITESPSPQMAEIGWTLRTLLLGQRSPSVLRDHKSSNRVYRRCASGTELVDWLMTLSQSIHSRHQATGMWQALLEEGVISHVTGEHPFRDKAMLYRFWQDEDGSNEMPTEDEMVQAEDQLNASLSTLGQRGPDAMMRMILRKPDQVTGEHPFRDKAMLYRFWQDEDGSNEMPTEDEMVQAEDQLNASLSTLGQRGPDAMMRMILRKPYTVMAGTPQKMLEHLLETRLDGRGGGGSVGGRDSLPSISSDPFLEDFLLTHIELATELEADCIQWSSLQEEASLMHHVMSQLRRYQDERALNAGQKWKLPPCGQPISLFSGATENRTVIRPTHDSEMLLTALAEQEGPTEGMDVDLELFSTKELAYHMTLFDWDLFWCVHEYELIYHTFGRHHFGQITANLDVFLRRFNEIQFWVVTEFCKEFQNLNAFFAIVMGLSNVAVSRLSLTWEKLPSKFRKLFTEFESLIDPSRNHRAYRISVGKLQPPVVPFMPLLLKDMTFTHEGNKTCLDGLVNFEKMHMLAQTMRTIRYCRSRHLVLEPPSPKSEAEVRSYISCLRTIDNQRVLTSLSQKLEPRRS
ncbi:hypothetical protein C0J52_07838 [Blattella germanica]|nr:hypothetical protein C0J52_07838 [Blattella germanica]